MDFAIKQLKYHAKVQFFDKDINSHSRFPHNKM